MGLSIPDILSEKDWYQRISTAYYRLRYTELLILKPSDGFRHCSIYIIHNIIQLTAAVSDTTVMRDVISGHLQSGIGTQCTFFIRILVDNIKIA